MIVHNTDSFVLSANTKDNIEDFLISAFWMKIKLFSNKNKKAIGKIKIESPIKKFGLLNLFVWGGKCIHLNVEKIANINKRLF